MLTIRKWAKWQRGIISSVKKSREARAAKGQDVDLDAPLTMQHISIATSWDRDFIETFGELVGQRNAETYFIRVLQYVALHDGFTGDCPVERHEFGEIVLSRRRDKVSRREGEKVYDALIASRVANLSHPVTHSEPDSNATRARTPCPALPCPDVPGLPPPGPDRDGGDSAPPPPGNGNGALSADDLGVFETLWRRREKMLAADSSEADRLCAAHRSGTADPDAIRAFIDRLTPKFIDDVTKTRRAFRMAANGRNAR